MKRVIIVAFCILLLCGLALMMKAGKVMAYKTGYTVNDYVAITTPTMDGNWTTPDEWTDAEEKQLDGPLNATFRLKYTADYPNWVNQYYLIEFFDDNKTIQMIIGKYATLQQPPLGAIQPAVPPLRQTAIE